jgi:hypothetical protein
LRVSVETNTIFKGLVLMFAMVLSLLTAAASFLGGGTSGFLRNAQEVHCIPKLFLLDPIKLSWKGNRTLNSVKSLLKNVRATQTG